MHVMFCALRLFPSRLRPSIRAMIPHVGVGDSRADLTLPFSQPRHGHPALVRSLARAVPPHLVVSFCGMPCFTIKWRAPCRTECDFTAELQSQTP